MDFKIKKALEHLSKRLSKKTAYAPTSYDKQSLNEIILDYKAKETQINISQEPFAKMYLYLYLQLLRKREFHDPTITPARLLNDVLKNPLNILIQEIQSEINTIELSNALSKDKEIKHPLQVENKGVNHVDYEKLINLQTSYEDVSNILLANVNRILSNYD